MRIAQFVAISALVAVQSQAVYLGDSSKPEDAPLHAKAEPDSPLDALIFELDVDHNKKIDDNELSIIMTKVNDKKDGLITFSDLTQLVVLAGIKPTPAYLNDLWTKFKCHDGEFLQFEQFKGAIMAISPRIAFMVNNAKPG